MILSVNRPTPDPSQEGSKRSSASRQFPSWYLFSELATRANGARTLVRRNVSTVQARPQNSNASFAHQRPCGLKSALRRSIGRATTTLNIPLPGGEQAFVRVLSVPLLGGVS